MVVDQGLAKRPPRFIADEIFETFRAQGGVVRQLQEPVGQGAPVYVYRLMPQNGPCKAS